MSIGFLFKSDSVQWAMVQHRRQIAVALAAAIVLLGSWFEPALGQEKKPEAKPPAKKKTAPITASLYYPDIEPAKLFDYLKETFLVQFEGTSAVTGPLSLITKGGKEVDLQGMLELLNAELAEQNKVAKLEGQIVQVEARMATQVQWITLEHTQPELVVDWLKTLYLATAEDKPDESARKASEIMVHPNPEVSKIFVRGPKEVIKDIQDLVSKELDIAPTATGVGEGKMAPLKIKYLRLEYMDAREFHEVLQLDDTLGELTAAVAPNNTLIISSRDASIFAKLEEIKTTFDVDRMELRYIRLANADATKIAKLIGDIYAKAQKPQALPTALEAARKERLRLSPEEEYLSLAVTQEAFAEAGIYDPAIRERLSQALSVVAVAEFTIVPDAERNALFIHTFSRNFPKILELIKELDKPRDQVMIDVFITEVTLDDQTELGVDFTYGPQSFLSGTRSFQYTIQQKGDTSQIGGNLATGISYQLISDNITAFIKALEEAKKLDIITRPHLLTKDNTKAMISMGRKVPFIQTTTVSSEGAVSSNVIYQDVATKLEVTPQIHPDNYVSLTIIQTINDIGTETFQISKDFQPQVIIDRRAETQLRVKDGQTVCMGGFVSDKMRKVRRGVPVLCRLPILGYLFGFSATEKVKTELIIFITPHILATPQEMLRMTNEQRERSLTQPRSDSDTQIMGPQDELRQPPYRAPRAVVPLPQGELINDPPAEKAPLKIEPPAKTETQPKAATKPPKPEKKAKSAPKKLEDAKKPSE